jgi:hypothetical protein
MAVDFEILCVLAICVRLVRWENKRFTQRREGAKNAKVN